MKKTLYPKTKRIGGVQETLITEKLDGSNLGIFKLNGELLFAQRNHILYENGLEAVAYKGLIVWAKENHEALMGLCEGSGVFGEWIGMGQIDYGGTDIDKRFYIFAKANVYEDGGSIFMKNLNYQRELFIYPFQSQATPECMGIVPIVDKPKESPSVKYLDNLYITYSHLKAGRSVEGFIISTNAGVEKYVRLKNGILTRHKT